MKKLSLLAALFLLSASRVFSTVITPATGGSNISADSALSAVWTTLGPIAVAESNGNPGRSDFAKGTNVTLVLKAPAGFQFNTGVAPNVTFTAGKDISAASATFNNSSTMTLTFTVATTNNNDVITIGSATGLQVRATGGSPLASGNIYRPTAGGTAVIVGISSSTNSNGSGGTSFGALTETAGDATKLVFTTQPDGDIINEIFSVQPVIRCQDQFNNFTSRGLPATLNAVTVLNSGTGILLGTQTNNIGTTGGNGVLTHTDLSIDTWGPNKELVVAAAGLVSATSVRFQVSKGTQTITFDPVADKVYNDPPFTANATASSGLPVTFSIVSGPATISENIIALTGVGTVMVRATQAGNGSYLAVSSDVSFNVTPATPIISWSNPADISAGTAISANQLNATADVPGTFVYTPDFGTVLSVGSNQTLTVVFQPDSANYKSVTNTASINVLTALAAPRLVIQGVTNGNISLSITGGSPDQTYQIEFAESLDGTWQSLTSVALDSLGEKVLEDSSATNSSMRFYRISAP